MDLQELITRGRFIFDGAGQRLKIFQLIDGKKSVPSLAKTTRRHPHSVQRDIRQLANVGLIEKKLDHAGSPITVQSYPIYQKVPLARAIPLSYFQGTSKLSTSTPAKNRPTATRTTKPQQLPVPNENELLDICREGEDQLYEFKASGTDVRKISREIAAMANTKRGGIVFYGIDDAGTIQGTDVKRQQLDQPLQNSIKNSISPAITVTIKSLNAMGTPILAIVVPPWNRRDVYQFDEKVLLRKGTNVFAAKPEELRKLHAGIAVV